MLAPSSGMSWFCGFLFSDPTAVQDVLCFGRRTEKFPWMTEPTKYNAAWMESATSQTGTGTNAPSFFLGTKQELNKVRIKEFPHYLILDISNFNCSDALIL